MRGGSLKVSLVREEIRRIKCDDYFCTGMGSVIKQGTCIFLLQRWCDTHTLSSGGKIGSCDGSYGVYSILLYSNSSSSVQAPLAVTPLTLFLQHWSPIAHPLTLLSPLLRPLLYMAWLCSQSSVKQPNPSMIGRQPVHLHRLPVV